MIKPIMPFEPISSLKIIQNEQWIAQIKWDGVRVLTYFIDGYVKLYNRKLNERTYNYPELTEINKFCSADSVILDGEIIALDDEGNPSFHEVMRRDGIRRYERVKLLREQVPIIYMVFDVIYLNGKWINDLRLKERLSILSEIVTPSNFVQLVESHNNGQVLFETIKKHQLEGIVVKNLDSAYTIGGKDNRWQKIKNYQDLIAVIGGVTMRDGVVNSLLLGLYDDSNILYYIGNAGTGKLTTNDWRYLTDKIRPLLRNNSPFINKFDKIDNILWVKPVISVKVKFIGWTKGNTLRQPSIQGIIEL